MVWFRHYRRRMATEARPETEPEHPPRPMWRRPSVIVAGAVIVVVGMVLLSSISFSGVENPATLPLVQDLDREDVGARDRDPAPDFDIPLLGEGRFSLSEHLATDGRPVFMNLWASWCFPCREEMPAIDVAAARHPGVHFIGVAVQDELDPAEAFIDEIGVSYMIAFDRDGVVDRSYSPLGLPASYIISESGVILERMFGLLDEDLIDAKLAQYFGG